MKIKNIIKTILRGFLTTLLIFAFTMIPLVIFVEKTINEDLMGTYLKESISENIKQNVTADSDLNLTEEQQTKIQQELEESESLNNFIEKYQDKILNDFIQENLNPEEVDIEEDIRQILLDNKGVVEEITGKTFTDEEYESIINKELEKENPNIAYQQIVKDTKNSLGEEEKQILKGYNTITSTEFIVIVSILSVISIIIIALLKKPYYKWIVNIAIASIVSALLIALVASSIVLIINTVLNSNNFTYMVSATPMLITAGIMIGISIILFIANYYLDLRWEEKNEVS